MRVRLIILFCFGFLIVSSEAQVVNIESYRSKTDTAGWSGTVGVFGYIRKNQNLIYSLGTNFHIDYLKGRHLYLLTNKFNYLQVNDKSYDYNGFLHFRYNYKYNDFLRQEFFIQTQFNTQLYTKSRDLSGIGLRFKLTKQDNFRIYFGTTYMYEFELWLDNTKHYTQRISNYISFNINIGKKIQFTGTTYYQPEIGLFKNYHIFTDNKITLKLSKRFQIAYGYELLYDVKPPMDAPTTIYYTYNSINYRF